VNNKEENTELCPDCGRYAGPVSKCPYCAGVTDVAGIRRKMKVATVTLVVAGLAFLYLMAVNRDIDVVAINTITPMMNYAPVRVAGKVVRTPYISKAAGKVTYFSFLVDDGSGSLRVSARGTVAAEIVDSGILPHKGDKVDVSGRLSAKGNENYKLQILAAEQIVNRE
jgi:cytochrome c-type biogenesis protein CcmE